MDAPLLPSPPPPSFFHNVVSGVEQFASFAKTQLTQLTYLNSNPLHLPIREGDHEAIERFLSFCPHLVNQSDRATSDTPLLVAMERVKSHPEDFFLIGRLLDAGADVSHVTGTGETVLHRAVQDGNIHVIRCLLGHVDDLNSHPGDLLHAGVRTGSMEVVKLLLESGADVNKATSSRGQTALMRAATMHKLEMIRVLVAHGADVNAVDHTGKTALERALTSHMLDVVRVLLSVPGIRVENRLDGSSVLGDYCGWFVPNIPVLKLFLEAGADVNTGKGRPLTLAYQKANPEVAHWLIERGADVTLLECFMVKKQEEMKEHLQGISSFWRSSRHH
eukprot:TRINITY_DN4458_c0_g2_i1.p1 TRINITY_DN4458_c0_g2~~TRINITY_DN4458_c0_g2_i1.p1  ORF type:complete len:333 (-),score=43.50 TRINITY_DN4458_c0_g2_i1:22-1020(-)